MQNQFVTTYTLWANYPIEAELRTDISTNMLGGYLLDTLGMELPPYHRFLMQMSEEIPAINVNGYLDKNGLMHWIGEENKEYDEILNEYHILQYNNMFDKHRRVIK